MKWMDHFLSAGSPAGKIICPNKKCNAKLGNYDWAGVHCGCKNWVTPVSAYSNRFSFVLLKLAPIDSCLGILHQPIQGRRSRINRCSLPCINYTVAGIKFHLFLLWIFSCVLASCYLSTFQPNSRSRCDELYHDTETYTDPIQSLKPPYVSCQVSPSHVAKMFLHLKCRHVSLWAPELFREDRGTILPPTTESLHCIREHAHECHLDSVSYDSKICEVKQIPKWL